MRPSCLLFDLDGTLVNSAALHEKAFKTALERHAPHLAPDFHYPAYAGWATLEVFLALGLDPNSSQSCTQTKQGLYRQWVSEGQLELMVGARSLLEGLRARGQRLFLVTGGSRESVQAALASTALGEHFEGLVTGSDCVRGKPDPEPYLHCLGRFQLSPGDCLVVEDSEAGVESARAAGLRVVCVHGPQGPGLDELRGQWGL